MSDAHPPNQSPAADLAMDAATGDLATRPPNAILWPASPEELAASALHRAAALRACSCDMPASLTSKLDAMIDAGVEVEAPSLLPGQVPGQLPGQASPALRYIAAESPSAPASPHTAPIGARTAWFPWAVASAAGIAFAITFVSMQRSVAQREEALAKAREQIVMLTGRVQENDVLLAAARSDLSKLSVESAAIAQRELALADQLNEATRKYASLESDHVRAQLKIATFEAPADPAELQRNRTKLLEVPGTVRLAWSDFNLEGAAPPEQPGLKGDAVWNDEQQTGYLRFVGLKPNDPKTEQYQVWVIDERGMEQKVSGGVFNATADGEVIVPIHPGIDVGKVVLFAVTIEKPGGTWVPDLKRRLVVAPRGA